MFGIFKRKTKIQSIAQEVPSLLLSMFGDKSTYAPDEIDIALLQLGYDKQKDIHHHQYAYGMFSSESSYRQLGLIDELETTDTFSVRLGRCYSILPSLLICISILLFLRSITKRLIRYINPFTVPQLFSIAWHSFLACFSNTFF